MEKRNQSAEDYLEALLQIEKDNDVIRSVDVANRLGVTRASVSRAMTALKGDGYINMEYYGDVTLTEKGRERAASVRERHDALKRFLVEVLGVSQTVAEEDACKMEHDLSEESFSKFKKYIERL